MFLEMMQRRNPALIDAAVWLHRSGAIQPDTYVIDLDAVRANAAALAAAGASHDVELWFVAKQYGRNPLVSAAVAKHIPLATAIDHREADALADAGAQLANLGHLVQIPVRRLPDLLTRNPRWATVYDEANLVALDAAVGATGRTQDVLLKIASAPSDVYPGQDGGFTIDRVPHVLEVASRLKNIRIGGATGFPCFVFDAARQVPCSTETHDRVVRAGSVLREHGIEPKLALPSHTSVSTMPMVARHGAFAEPGHALTGTTPEHAVNASLREIPAMLYVSEIAQLGQTPSVFGGGFYPRGRARSLLVDTSSGRRGATLRDADPANIDYYRRFDWEGGGPSASLGDTAIMAFRTQIFVTRSQVAVVSGVATDTPRLEGIHDALGRVAR